MGSGLPLADVKVLDFTWVMAGPATTRMLADYGATIVRIESPSRIDTARTLQPFLNDKSGSDKSGLYGNCNAGKLGVALDLKNPRTREIVLDLVRWADVVAESFSPGTIRDLGFDYESLRKINPDLIMLSTCLMGQSGPHSRLAGFGNMAAAITGFYDLTGWADRAPAGPFGAYTDYIVPRFSAAALLAALDHRRRTGQGQYIDQSQAEAALHVLGPALLDYTANGRVQSRAGNSDARFAPHGVYPAAGEDRWIAIACRDDNDWTNLCAVMNRHDLAVDAAFANASRRLDHRDELDAIVGQWSRTLDAHQAESLLQARGVPAHEVQNSTETWRDPQLRHRGHFVELEHPALGKFTIEGSRARLSRTPAEVRRPAPSVGQDNAYVLKTTLGYDQERITELALGGVFG
jgi:crotonobetainyl-CoA:carnitine CoA-transferase CaiB-like acyl-CoA transferase